MLKPINNGIKTAYKPSVTRAPPCTYHHFFIRQLEDTHAHFAFWHRLANPAKTSLGYEANSRTRPQINASLINEYRSVFYSVCIGITSQASVNRASAACTSGSSNVTFKLLSFLCKTVRDMTNVLTKFEDDSWPWMFHKFSNN